MKSLLITALAGFVAAAPLPLLAEQTLPEVPQQGYSVEPLHSPLFDETQTIVETNKIINWLNSHIQSLSYDQMKGPREYLYYLIDSRVKQIYAADKRVLPSKADPVLEALFSWSEPLGVFGGAYAFNAVKSPDRPARTPGLQLPQGIEMTLNKDLFTLSSTLGWSITFPYYFMTWDVRDETPEGGPRTQLVILSTGAAKDASVGGRSQATIMFLFSPNKDSEFPESYWSEKMGIGADVKPTSLGIRSLQSRHVVDDVLKLHKEITSWSASNGTYTVAYLGNEGTYEWNRPHFLDFLRMVTF